MPTRETFNAPWTRKHDNPKNPLLASVPRQFHPVDLRGLIEAEAPTGLADRIEIAGPPTEIPALRVQPFALIVHELMANAVIHGALCTANGSICITWTVSATNRVELAWRETGSNEIAQEDLEKTGIGLQLVKSLVELQLGGQMSSSRLRTR